MKETAEPLGSLSPQHQATGQAVLTATPIQHNPTQHPPHLEGSGEGRYRQREGEEREIQ